MTDSPEGARVVGLQPWLPWPLSRSPWWTAPVPAERLAALRIGLAAVLLLDLLATWAPDLLLLFGTEGLGDPGQFRGFWWPRGWAWSLLAGADDNGVRWALAAWAASAVCLLLGLLSRPSAAVAWALSVSFVNRNPYAVNGGDVIRSIVLFYLMLSPCGAAWSLDRLLMRRGRSGLVLVPPWPLRLLFVQLVLMYFLNGLYKLTGSDWPAGRSFYYVLCDPGVSRFSYALLPVPAWLTCLLTWAVLAWEAGFPLWVALPWTRRAALVLGVLFHLGILLTMELGAFALYALILYVPLLPWERWRRGPAAGRLRAGPVSVTKGQEDLNLVESP